MAGSIRPHGTKRDVWVVRELNNPQGDEGADGRNMTSSDCVLRDGSGPPTSAGKPGRHRNTGGEVKYEVGRPHVKSQAAIATQDKGCSEKQASEQNQSGSSRMELQEQSGSSRRRQHARQRKAGTL